MSIYSFSVNTYNSLDEAQTAMTTRLEEIENSGIQEYISIKLIERRSTGVFIHPQELSRVYIEEGKEYLMTVLLNGRTHITDDITLIDILINDAKEKYIEHGAYNIIYELDADTKDILGVYDKNGNYVKAISQEDVVDTGNIDDIIEEIINP